MAWRIDPFSGLNDVKFSTDPVTVARILGPIKNSDLFCGGTLTEYRGMHLPVCNYVENKLQCLDTHWSMAPLLLAGKDLFAMGSVDLLRHLETLNRGAAYLYGTIIFMDIGLSASNYVEKDHSVVVLSEDDEDERGIGIFRAGAFEQFRKDCQPISFL